MPNPPVANRNMRSVLTTPALRPSSYKRNGRPRGEETRAAQTAIQMVPLGPTTSFDRNSEASTPARDVSLARAETRQPVQDAAAVVRRWFQFANLRDANAMSRLLSNECRHFDLPEADSEGGKDGALQMYRRVFESLPDDVTFGVEDATCGSLNKVGVIWHLLLGGHKIPNAHGVAWFTVDAANRITYVRESPMHFLRNIEVVLPLLNAASPVLRAGMPLLAPSGAPPALPLLPSLVPQPEAFVSELGQQLSSWLPFPFVEEGNSRLQAGDAHGPLLSFVEDLNSVARAAGLPTLVDVPPSSPRAALAHETVAQAADVRHEQPRVSDARVAAADAGHAATSVAPARGEERIAMRTLTQRKQMPSTSGRTAVQEAGSPSSAQAAVVARLDASNGEASEQVRRARSSEAAANMTGLWRKVRDLSDVEGYGRALDLLGVRGIQKATAMAIDGMEVEHTDELFAIFYLTVVPYFKVKEQYRFGAEVAQGRRDMRSGRQMATARQEGNRVIVDLSWGAPNGGRGHEEYWINDEGQLCAESTVTVNGKSETTLQVYARQGNGQVDQRYYSAKQSLPFGIDPNSISADLISMFR